MWIFTTILIVLSVIIAAHGICMVVTTEGIYRCVSALLTIASIWMIWEIARG